MNTKPELMDATDEAIALIIGIREDLKTWFDSLDERFDRLDEGLERLIANQTAISKQFEAKSANHLKAK